MKKLLFVITILFVLTLSGCKSDTRQLDRQWKRHNKTLDSWDVVEIKTTVSYLVNDSETDLESFMYVDNELEKTCVASDENDPREFTEYTVTCGAIYGSFNSEEAGFVPFMIADKYPVHPVYESAIFTDDILSYFTDSDLLEETDTVVRYRKIIDFDELNNPLLEQVITTGIELDYYEIPVIFNVIYDKELDMYTSFVIDNTDVMSHLYQLNFGNDLDLQEYTVTVEYTEYTDDVEFFYPSDDVVFDEDVNYFDDGDFYGYREFAAGDTIEGELDYDSDQDIVMITVPVSGIYNLTYEQSSYQESILFALYNDNYELVYEGVVEEEGHELADLYLNTGSYYVVLFTHYNAEGYKLLYDRVQ